MEDLDWRIDFPYFLENEITPRDGDIFGTKDH